ncbi:MAG: PAS domain S-box protein [Gammaproteobacteria bacterium]|nr:PAS domain S-box protein [Gammaproteobacteria bacterium]MDH3412527.1 PAS domain S-box protein [Gammaproteobacteria bacterium]
MNELELRILVIEDEDDDFLRIQRLLREVAPGYQLHRVQSCKEAAVVIHESNFDVFLVDQQLADGEGIDLLPLILEIRAFAPIVMLSVERDRQLDERAVASGASDFVAKDTLTGDLLDRTIRYALEHKRMEKALAGSEARFRDLIESASDWYWETDADHKIIKVTGRFMEVVGIDSAKMIGTRQIDIIAEDLIHSDAIEPHIRCLEEHRPFREFVFPTRVGKKSVLWIRASGKPLFDDSGVFIGYRGTGSDATAEVEARREAEVARNRLTDALRSIPDGFALYDADDRLALYNENYAKAFGPDRDLLKVGATYDSMIRARIRRGHVPEAASNEAAWLAQRAAERSNPEGWREIKLADGRWVRTSERRTRDGGLVTIQTDISEIKQRERQLGEGEERFRDMVDSASDWFFETDDEMRFTYVSDNLLTITGYTRDQLLGANRMEYLVVEDTDPDALETYQAALAERKPYRRFIYTIRTASGDKLWVSSSASSFFDAQGHFLGYRGTGTNITEGMRARKELELAKTRLMDAIDSISDGIFLYDADDRLVVCNEAYRRDHKDYLQLLEPGTRFEDLLRGWAKRQFRDEVSAELYVQGRMRSHRDPKESIEVRPSNGRIYRLTERRTKEGGVVGVSTDISEIRRQSDRLHQSERQFRAIFENAATGIATLSLRGRFVAANDALCQMLGLDAEKLTAVRLQELVNPEQHERCNELLNPAAKSTEHESVTALTFQRGDGSEMLAQLSCGTVQGPDEEPSHFVLTVTDVTGAREAENRLRQAQKMEAIGQLAGGIAHDFNNLLTIIRGNLSLLAREVSGKSLNKDWQEIIEDGLSASRRAKDLIQSLLSISRKDALRPVLLDVRDVVSEAQRLLQRTLPGNIQVSADFQGGQFTLRADESYLHTAILNLCLNARDAMASGGHLRIIVASTDITPSRQTDLTLTPGRYITISISDNGVGMRPEVKQRVLEPLFTTKSRGRGSGLGLTMVSGFVRECGGDVSIDSTQGKGTTVTLYIPRKEVQAKARSRVDGAVKMKDFNLIVVDDDAEVRRFARRILARLGHHVAEAGDAEEALSQIDSNPDLSALITDIQMPGELDGIGLAQRVRNSYPGLPILLITGSSDAAKRAVTMEDAGTGVIQKPFHADELERALEAIGVHEARRTA